jgi:hypothetical protein
MEEEFREPGKKSAQQEELAYPQSEVNEPEKEMMLVPIEGNYKFCFLAVAESTSVGRHSSNKLVI